MAWDITGYSMAAAAPIQAATVLNAGTASQQAGQAVWVNNTGTASAQVTLTLPGTLSGGSATIIGTAPVGTTIFPVAATNYTTSSSGIVAYTVRTTS